MAHVFTDHLQGEKRIIINARIFAQVIVGLVGHGGHGPYHQHNDARDQKDHQHFRQRESFPVYSHQFPTQVDKLTARLTPPGSVQVVATSTSLAGVHGVVAPAFVSAVVQVMLPMEEALEAVLTPA